MYSSVQSCSAFSDASIWEKFFDLIEKAMVGHSVREVHLEELMKAVAVVTDSARRP